MPVSGRSCRAPLLSPTCRGPPDSAPYPLPKDIIWKVETPAWASELLLCLLRAPWESQKPGEQEGPTPMGQQL